MLQGPGQLTRALLNLPKTRIKKLIVLEPHEPYLAFLKVRAVVFSLFSNLIIAQPLEAIDQRVKVVPIAGNIWDSYQILEDMGVLEGVADIPWNESGKAFFTARPRHNSHAQFTRNYSSYRTCPLRFRESSSLRSCFVVYQINSGCLNMAAYP